MSPLFSAGGDRSFWTQIAESTNATATATRNGGTGKRIRVTSVTGSFSIEPANAVKMELRENGTEIYSVFVAGPVSVQFEKPIELAAGATAELVLPAGGIGSIGQVSLTGRTVRED